ncbi:5-(carboxyamino)imidazole ribonucleotide mutase [Rubritalea spongiae]|uniref:N5-carboxyaminoimidazole ribonucleotide mutase n=1 Tax=Rubritalea spongiae TaxID=430797 RepID=A0ABW5E1Y8_9BACT
MKKVAIVMGSNSDWPTMKLAAEALDKFGISYEAKVISAHRTPLGMVKFAQEAEEKGFEVIIAGAGGAAHLPGMIAAITTLPVLGCPVKSSALNGQDSLLSIVQMPKGIPVATFAIGPAGAANAGLFAVSMLAGNDPELNAKLKAYRQEMVEMVAEMKLED